MHHGRGYEGQRVAAQFQLVPFFHHDAAGGIVCTGKVFHHGECLGGRYYFGFRIGGHKSCDTGGMVRLHVLHNQVIRLPAFQCRFQVALPFLHKMTVSRIHHRDLFIQDHIGIVCHAFRHDIHAFKKIDFMIVHTDITDILCHIHCSFSSRIHSVVILSQVLNPNNY